MVKEYRECHAESCSGEDPAIVPEISRPAGILSRPRAVDTCNGTERRGTWIESISEIVMQAKTWGDGRYTGTWVCMIRLRMWWMRMRPRDICRDRMHARGFSILYCEERN